MSFYQKRPVTAQRIAYWKAAEFIGSGATCFKKGTQCCVGMWTSDYEGKRRLDLLGTGFTWDEALTAAKVAVEALRRKP